MQVDPPGFLRPVQTAPLDAAQEQTIAAICPGLGQTVPKDNRPDHILWGPYKAVHTGYANDDTIRFVGSSGGALSMLLVHLIETGQVDGVIQTASSDDLVVGNKTILSIDSAQIVAAAGSRYAPSAPLSELAVHLASGRRYAFVGKPCDASALRALASRDPAIALTFPIILSFFCAGVPSHTGGKAVLKALGTDLEHTASFRFRGNGWPGRATATLKDGRELSMSYSESWGKILSKHVQHRCKICADGTGVAADIVCADAWASDDDGYPLFEESPGISLIMARTEAGASLLAEVHAAGHITLDRFDIQDLEAIQPGQRERRRAIGARLLGLILLGRPVPRYRGLRIVDAARQNPFARNLRNLVGTMRRALRHRRAAASTLPTKGH